jgi:hypothetical protein
MKARCDQRGKVRKCRKTEPNELMPATALTMLRAHDLMCGRCRRRNRRIPIIEEQMHTSCMKEAR